MKKPFRHISNGAIIRAWSAAKTDHHTEPEQQPAPRPLHQRQRIGTWADQPRSNGRDQHKRRAHLRRQQKQTRQQERTALIAQLKKQQ